MAFSDLTPENTIEDEDGNAIELTDGHLKVKNNPADSRQVIMYLAKIVERLENIEEKLRIINEDD